MQVWCGLAEAREQARACLGGDGDLLPTAVRALLRAGTAAAPATAAAAAVAVMAATGGGGPAPASSTVLTAAMVQRVASASALAQSGRAEITYRETDNGALQVSGTDSIATRTVPPISRNSRMER